MSAKDEKQAGQMAMRAGLDVGISYEPGYMGPLIESVKEGTGLGRISIAPCVECFGKARPRPVRASLRRCGPRRPGKPQSGARGFGAAGCRESIVLLKNDGVLPLRKDLGTIAVIGPNADDAVNQLGDYAPKSVLQEIVTVLGGIKRAVSPRTKVVYARGCDVVKPDKSRFARGGARSEECGRRDRGPR